MGLIGRTFQVVGALFLLLLGLSTYLYFVDYGVDAVVTDKGEDDEGPYIVVTTQPGEFHMRHHVPQDAWEAIEPGHPVIYHIQTGAVAVYDNAGQLLYASS